VEAGLPCALFHSKLPEKERASTFIAFMKEEIKVVVATICFGMGVNKKNIRFVINVGISLSA
jgi:ATP-dependent DNA helicase RecQ